MFWPSLLMTGDMWAAQADPLRRWSAGDPCRPAWARRQPEAHGPIYFRRLRPLHCRYPRRPGCGADALHRQLVGRDDRRHVRRDLSRSRRQGRPDELHRIGRGSAPEARVRVSSAHGQTARRDTAAVDAFGAQGLPRPDDIHDPPHCGRFRAGHRAGRRRALQCVGRQERGAEPAAISARCCRRCRRRCSWSPAPRMRRSR